MTIKIQCFTNIDDYKREQWPEALPAVPQVGQRMTAASGRQLAVCSLRWAYDGTLIVELHRWNPAR